MKKLITLYFLLLSFLSFSQNKGNVSSIYLGCYTDGDTLTKEAIKNYSNFKLNESGANSLGLKSWEIVLIQKERFGKKHKPIASGTNSDMITPEMKEAILSNFADIYEILIQNIVISFVDKYTSDLIDQQYPPIVFYLNDNAFKKCDQQVTATNSNVEYNGKLVTGKNKDLPIIDQKITLETFSNKELQSTTTNNYGNFTFTNLNSNDSYKINVPIDAQSKIKDGQVYMAKLDGTIIKKFNKTDKGFEYELLPNDVNIMTKVKEEDIELEMKKFNIASNSNVEYKGKLLTGKDKNLPLMDQKITLETFSNKELQSTTTNNYGNFTFTNLNSNDSYKINVPIDAQSKIKDGQVYMAKLDGTIIKKFNKTEKGFVYELLPNDVNIMTKVKEEDIELEMKKFNIASNNNVEYKGKLLTGKDKNLPLMDQKITLETFSNKELQSTTTNNYGNFTFTNLNSNDSYKINVPIDAQSKIKDGQVYMAKLDGTIIKKFNKTEKGFVYELLPNDVNIMTKVKEEDTELEITKLNTSNKTHTSSNNNVEYFGKLLTGKDKKVQLFDQKIILKTLTGIELQSVTTNTYGNFTLTDLNPKNSYKIIVLFNEQSKIKDGELYMAKLDGTIIKSFNKTPNGFEYELLPEEIK